MNPLAALEDKLRALDGEQLRRRRRTVDSPCGSRLQVDGRTLLAFCSNDYLGLAAHPAVVAALVEGAKRYGAGSGASHLISGHSRAHAALEERLARMFAAHWDEPRALYFSTGYLANLAVLSALGGRSAAIFSDALNHASLIDGARLSRARVAVYPHRDVAALAAALAGSAEPDKLIATDGVFSMDGDLAPLPELVALAERHGAWLVVDDAHGFGVLGERGHGILEHFGVRSPQLVLVGTLGKAAGVAGAFVVAHASVIEWLVNRARPYIFVTAAAPALAAALAASLELLEGEEGRARRKHLQALVARLRQALSLSRWRPLASSTAIQPIVVGENAAALAVAAALEAEGLWVPAIRPPTVPPGTARLRISLSAAHSAEDIDALAEALERIAARS